VSRHSLPKGIVALHVKDCTEEQRDMNKTGEDGEREDSTDSREKSLQLTSLSGKGDLEMVGWDYDQ